MLIGKKIYTKLCKEQVTILVRFALKIMWEWQGVFIRVLEIYFRLSTWRITRLDCSAKWLVLKLNWWMR